MRFDGAWWTASALAISLGFPSAARAEDALETARRLYAAAAYEDALKTLERAQPGTADTAATVAVEEQRLLCLVALGRPADAEGAMTAIVQADPLYVPDASTAPPRVRAAFKDVRARLLPAIARAQYEQARQAFEGADYADASAGFARVLSIVERSEGAGADPVLRDVALLAAGFKTLSDKAGAPAPSTPAAAPPVEAAAAAPVPPRVYDAAYPGLAAPTVVRQAVPQWPRTLGPPPNRDAVLAIVINEKGQVESARMTRVVHRTYDQLLLNAVSTWAYVPAQLAGEPVKFRKVIKLSFR
ncbi:MAG TPA: energy transducer TonB [Vicinamibacterales bacterium]|nr:energy transducer TonB [Vicinamibacterales bacterium]